MTLTIPVGMYGLLGPNGSGKSTLMRTIATLQEPDEGRIRLADIDVLNQKDEVRRTLGYLPQEFGVYPKVSAESCSITSRCSRASPNVARGRRSSKRSSGRRTCAACASRSSVAKPLGKR